MPESVRLGEARKAPERPLSQPPPVRVSQRPSAPEAVTRAPDVQTLRRGLLRSRETGGVFGRLKALFAGERAIDAALAQQIEEVLLSSDVGAATTLAIHGRLIDGMDSVEITNHD